MAGEQTRTLSFCLLTDSDEVLYNATCEKQTEWITVWLTLKCIDMLNWLFVLYGIYEPDNCRQWNFLVSIASVEPFFPEISRYDV